MEIKKFTVGDKEYEFVNEYRNTRHGFAHDTTLFINNVEKVKLIIVENILKTNSRKKTAIQN